MTGELSKYLLERPQYGGKNPLEAAVARELVALTERIAHEVVAEDPEIGDRIRNMIRQLVSQALAADGDLNLYVVQAVAKALATRALEIEKVEPE